MTVIDYFMDTIQRTYDNLPENQKIKFREDLKKQYKTNFDNILEKVIDRAIESPSMGILDITNTKFARMLREAVRSYEFGLFLSAISVCGVASERLCMDILANSDLTLGGRPLNTEEMEKLFRLQQSHMIELLSTWQLIDSDMRSKLIQIKDTRNKHIHPDKPLVGSTKLEVEQFRVEALKVLKNLKIVASKRYQAKIGKDGTIWSRPYDN